MMIRVLTFICFAIQVEIIHVIILHVLILTTYKGKNKEITIWLTPYSSYLVGMN
jgi:hypothetical protein